MKSQASEFIQAKKEANNYLGNMMDSAAWDEVVILMADFADQECDELRGDVEALRQRIGELQTETATLRRRLSDCERKRITGERH